MAHSWRLQSIAVVKGQWQEREAAGHNASNGKKQRVRSACVQLAFPFLHRDQGSCSLYFPRSLKNLNYAFLSRPGFCLPVESLDKNFLSTPHGLGLSQTFGVKMGEWDKHHTPGSLASTSPFNPKTCPV